MSFGLPFSSAAFSAAETASLIQGTGGIVVGGSSTPIIRFLPTGGMVVAGSPSVISTFRPTNTGGLLVAGYNVDNISARGGILTNGYHIVTGQPVKLLIGGAGTSTAKMFNQGTGGILLAGNANVISFTFNNGGVIIGGQALLVVLVGGLKMGGEAIALYNKFICSPTQELCCLAKKKTKIYLSRRRDSRQSTSAMLPNIIQCTQDGFLAAKAAETFVFPARTRNNNTNNKTELDTSLLTTKQTGYIANIIPDKTIPIVTSQTVAPRVTRKAKLTTPIFDKTSLIFRAANTKNSKSNAFVPKLVSN